MGEHEDSPEFQKRLQEIEADFVSAKERHGSEDDWMLGYLQELNEQDLASEAPEFALQRKEAIARIRSDMETTHAAAKMLHWLKLIPEAEVSDIIEDIAHPEGRDASLPAGEVPFMNALIGTINEYLERKEITLATTKAQLAALLQERHEQLQKDLVALHKPQTS